MKKTTAQKNILVTLAGLGAAVLMMGAAGSAHAAGVTGAASQVEYNAGNSSNPTLMVQVNGNTSINYYAQQTSPCSGVPSLSADTVKIFLSMAQAAVLAGKNITIYYNTCSGSTTPYIYDIVMAK